MPLRDSRRLETGEGMLAKVNTALDPLTVPPGVSPSTNVAAGALVVAFATRPFTVVCRLETVLVRPPTVELNPPTVEVTVLSELDIAFR